MQNTTEPGDTPEWKKKLKGLSSTNRQMLAIALGVSDRTLQNWANGKTAPRAYAVHRIIKWKAKA